MNDGPSLLVKQQWWLVNSRSWIELSLRFHISSLCASVAVCLHLLLCTSDANAQIAGEPGAFSRMGFGPRGIGMGNAMTAVVSGELASYYNPAVIPWTTTRYAQAAYGILSLDRQFNTLNATLALPPRAGLSFGILNAGVRNIDGRDGDGEQTGMLSTSENQVTLGFAVKFPDSWSAGVNIKLYYYRLYTEVSSLTVGLDFGLLVPVAEGLTVGAAVRDVNSKYKWDTAPLFGQQGQASSDRFPILGSVGAAWQMPDSLLLISADIEFSNTRSFIARAGVEVPLLNEVTLRAGIDRIDLRDKGMGIKPSFGFTARKELDGWAPCVNYAFVIEPFAPNGMHVVAIAVRF